MADMVIEKNIPVPTRKNNGVMAILKELEIGDSFVSKYKNQAAFAGLLTKLRPKRFTCRRIDAETFRIWRIE